MLCRCGKLFSHNYKASIAVPSSKLEFSFFHSYNYLIDPDIFLIPTLRSPCLQSWSSPCIRSSQSQHRHNADQNQERIGKEKLLKRPCHVSQTGRETFNSPMRWKRAPWPHIPNLKAIESFIPSIFINICGRGIGNLKTYSILSYLDQISTIQSWFLFKIRVKTGYAGLELVDQEFNAKIGGFE